MQPAEEKIKDIPEEKPLSSEEIKEKILDLMPISDYIGYIESVITGENILISEIYPEDETKIKKDSHEKLETVRALLRLGKISKEDVVNPDLAKRTSALQKGAARIGEVLRKSWGQEDVKLKIVADQQSLAILFRDGKNIPKEDKENDNKWIWTLPEDRSTGFRWYITFYVKYLAKLETSKNVLFLIDEAGGPLNKVAQEDLLRELVTRANKDTDIQIIYTTHSNHMINWDFRNNIRLVEKQDGRGTKVVEMWWVNYSPDKLPSPLQEIGFVWDEDILKRDNLVVEGYSDVYVFHNLPIKFSPDLTINPYEGFKISSAGGASVMADIGKMCQLKKRKAFLIYDSDKMGLKYKKEAEPLKKSGELDLYDIASLVPSTKYKIETIEDLLPVSDFLIPLNKYAKPYFKEKWNDIQLLQGVGSEGVMGLIIKRIVANEITEDEVRDFFKVYKYLIIVETVDSISRESYKKVEQMESVISFFNQVQLKLQSLKA